MAGAGCPYCSGRKLLSGFNDLVTVNPELAAKWSASKNDALTPRDVKANGSVKAWWIYEKSHEWQALVSDKARGKGYLYCAGVKLLPGFNDLATVDPELAKDWHPTRNGDLTPDKVMGRSGKKVW